MEENSRLSYIPEAFANNVMKKQIILIHVPLVAKDVSTSATGRAESLVEYMAHFHSEEVDQIWKK